MVAIYVKKIMILSVLLLTLILINTKIMARENWSEVSHYKIDINNDNHAEEVVLYTSAKSNENKIFHEDKEWWKLSVFEKQHEKVLYKELLTLGNIYVTIGQDRITKNTVIVMIKDVANSLEFLTYIRKGRTLKKQEVVSVNKKVFSVIPYFGRDNTLHATAYDGPRWDELCNYSIDLNNDGKMDKVKVLFMAEVYGSSFTFDEKFHWKLNISENGKSKDIYKEYTLDRLHVTVGTVGKNKNPIIVLIKDGKSSFSVIEFLREGIGTNYKRKVVLSVKKKVSSAITFP